MDLDKNYDLSFLVNDTERLVFAELGKRVDDFEEKGICSCQDCIVDMVTLALNSLPAHYHASLLGSMYASASDERFSEEVKKAVDTAIEKVSSNPAHIQ